MGGYVGVCVCWCERGVLVWVCGWVFLCMSECTYVWECVRSCVHVGVVHVWK